MVFDKTGTLTYGLPVLEQIIPANGVPPAELLRQAASVEQLSSHLLGRTLAQAAQEAGEGAAAPLPLPEQFQEVAGRGVAGRLDGHPILVGSARFLAERLGPSALAGLAQLPIPAQAGTVLSAYIAVDEKLAGVALFGDRLRPGVPELMQRLRTQGVQHIALLTGDRLDNARAVAQAAQMDEVLADLLPADKVAAVQRLKAQYDPLVMVGDGINDAPALATATVGVAMGAHGTGISAEAADVVLLVDDVTRVGEAVAISQHTLRIVRQSIGIGLGLSVLLMIIASVGLLPPPVGALCQEVIDVLVILNALRAR